MVRKIIVFGIAISLVIVAVQAKFADEVVAPVYDSITRFVTVKEKVTPKTEFPSGFEKQILAKINLEREKNKQKALVWNDDLAKAAKTRGLIINILDDYSGTISGLTREKAYDLVNYETSYFGDLYLFIANPNDNFTEEIMKEKTQREIILLEKFTEAGVALAGSGEYSKYYILFGNRRPKTVQTVAPTKTKSKITWGGPELWTAVNNRRVQFGVGQLSRKDELCTIASIRLNQLLDIGKLDGHAGFKPVLDRSDLKWISEKYNISEFLAQGYSSPEETVKGWENTLGHRSLLTGGEFVWGCVYSQNSFAVAITAY